MVRVLYLSRNKKTKQFTKWATETLFIAQIGTTEQKQELSAKMLGVSAQAVKDAFSVNADKTPVIYLYIVGKAKQIDNKYSDNEYICKFGYTDDLPRRNIEHAKTFNKEFKTEIDLVCFSIIETRWLSDAETQVKNYFESHRLEYKTYKELVVIDRKQMDQVKKFYSMIQKSFIGRYEHLEKMITDIKTKYENELKEERYKNEMAAKQYQNEINQQKYKSELLEKEYIILQKDNENNMLKKDLEIERLRNQLYEMKK